MSATGGAPRLFGQGTVSGDAAWSLAYTALVRVATFGISVAVARLIGSAGAGALGVALQVTALGSMLAAFSLPLGMSKQLAESEDPGRRSLLLRASGGVVLALGGAIAIGVSVFAGFVATSIYGDAALQPALAWCGPLVLVTAATLWVEGAMQGLRRFDRLAGWGAVVSILDLAVGVAASLWGIAAVLAGRAAVRGLAVLFVVVRWLPLRAATPPPPATRPRDPAGAWSPIGSLMGFAGPALLASVIVLGGQTVLRLMLVRSAGLDAAGHYQAADGLGQGLLLIPGAAAAAFMRSVASDKANDFASLRTTLPRALAQVTAWNLPVCLLLIGLSSWIVPGIFGAAFLPAHPVLVVLGIAYGLAGPGAVFGAVLFGRGEVWKGVVVNALWVVMALAVFRFGSVALGAPGAAVALAAAYLGLVILCVATLVPSWPVAISGVVPPLAVTVLCLSAGAGLALAPGVPSWAAALGCGVMSAAVFGAWGLPSLVPPRARDRA